MNHARSGFAVAPLILVVVFVGLLIYYMRTGIGLPSLSLERSASSTTSSFPGFSGRVPLMDDEEGPIIRPRATSSQTKLLPPRDVPAGFTPEELSPNYKKVRISSISPGLGTSPSRIALQANTSGAEAVSLGGWTFRSNRDSQRIAQAVELYAPYGLLTPQGIVLGQSDFLNIYSAASPIGVNVRTNKCFGYLERHIDFNPRFGVGCPALDRTPVPSFTGVCQDYLRSLGSCVEPLSNPPVPHDDYACRDYLAKINYTSCFEKHRGDTDFLRREWRIWAKTKFMDPKHDRILLLDAQGLLVDLFIY